MKGRILKMLVTLSVLVMAAGALGPAVAEPVPMQAPDQATMEASMAEAADWLMTVVGADGQMDPPFGSPFGEDESGGRVSLNGLALLRAYQVTGDESYMDRARACGDLVIACVQAGTSYVVDRTGVLVTDAGGGFTNAQAGKVDDAYQAGYSGTIRFQLWESLQGMWFMCQMYAATGEAKYQNCALLLDRLVGTEYYVNDEALQGLVGYVDLPASGTWAKGGRASTYDHALLLLVIACGEQSVPNLWRDRYDIITYVRSALLPDGSFDDKNPLPRQDGPNETKHAIMVPALYDLGRPKEARDLTAWVLSKQRPDGAFSCPHDKDVVGDTAAAALGLLPVGEVAHGGDAISWLIGQQRTDGSWNAITGLDITTSVMLSTEWGMLALHAGLTNYNLHLERSMVTVTPVWEGDPARVMAFSVDVTVENEGLVDVDGAQVRLYDGPRGGGSPLAQKTVDVPALGNASEMLEFRPTERGPHEIHVWVEYAHGGEFQTQDNNITVPVNLNREPSGTIATPQKDQLFGFGASIEFTAADVEDPDGDTVTLTWVDDVTGVLSHEPAFATVLPPGEHRVTLTFEDGNGPSTSAEVTFSVRQNIPPTIRISTPAEGARYFDYQTITLDASATSDAEEHPLNFSWDSSIDGFLGNGAVVSRKLTYGEHLISVWVNDGWDNVSKWVSIFVVKTFPPDVVIASPMDGETYVTTTRVSFDANGTSDADSEILEYFWRSNIDGLLSEHPSFLRYLSVGHHIITLSVNDGNYNRSKSVEIDVLENRAPVAEITSPEHGATFHSQDLIELNASGSYDLEDPITLFWVSDRSGPLGSEPVLVRHLARGLHTITLWVNDGHGHNVSTSIELTVLNLGPTAGISSPETGASYVTGISVPFMSGTSSDPEGDKLTYEWYLRPVNGEWSMIGTTARVDRTFSDAGTYDVKLVVSDGKETNETMVQFRVKQGDTVEEEDGGLLSNQVLWMAVVLVLVVVVGIAIVYMKGRY